MRDRRIHKKSMKNEPKNPASLVAVSLLEDESVLAAVITSRSLEGLPTIEVKHYEPNNFRLTIDQAAFVASDNYTYRTKPLALHPEASEMGDVDLAAYLIQADQTGANMADGKMLLEDGAILENQVAQITRLPNDAVALTQLPRADLNDVTESVRQLYFPEGIAEEKRESLAERIPPMVAETSLRAAFRAYLVESRPTDNNMLTVFVMTTEAGFAFGFWNSMWGLFREFSESLPEEFSNEGLILDDAEEAEEFRNTSLSGFLSHALVSAIRAAFESLHENGFAGIERIVFAVPRYLLHLAEPLVEKVSEEENVEILLIPEDLNNQILRGLLYSQIDRNPLVEANLCRDLYVRLVDNSLAVEQAKKIRQAERKFKVMTAMFVPVFLLFGFIAGSFLYQAITSARLSMRDYNADAETARLKPILEARNAYIGNFNWRESYLTQTLGKKDQQTIAISFLPEVDKKYALSSGDSNFALSNIKLENSGEFEMKGISTNEDKVTMFVRGLEYADNGTDPKRIFNNLTFEVRRGTNEKQVANSNFKSSFSNIPPGYIGWLIKGTYAPLSAVAVPDPKKKPAANQKPAVQNSPATPNNSANPAPDANTASNKQ